VMPDATMPSQASAGSMVTWLSRLAAAYSSASGARMSTISRSMSSERGVSSMPLGAWA